jgi:hypothetical protein
MPARQKNRFSSARRQRGAVLMLLLLLVSVGVLAVFVSGLNRATQQQERDRITAAALAHAKEALIGFAAGVDISTTGRPGDLPCPDIDNDGIAETGCGNASGSTGQSLRLGRLPWKSLGLPDLRDGYGERLWYAVSNNFKKNTRTATLNSDTPGTINVRDSTGTIVNDGSNFTAAIAVIISPGRVLTRQDGVNQVRDAANANNPVNYLDIGNGEDNAVFVDGSADGFISGDVRDAASNIIVNDRVLSVTYDNLMPLLEQRVAREAFNCLKDYASDPLNQGRLPWAADMTASAVGNYSDATNTRFGRLPSTFSNTVADSGSSPMKNGWTASCNLNLGTWWNNWREMVFYAVAEAYKPRPLPPPPVCGTCLSINPPSAAANKQFAVFMARKRLPAIPGGQPRTTSAEKGSIANYLEGQNSTPLDDMFERNSITSSFNDATLFAP